MTFLRNAWYVGAWSNEVHGERLLYRKIIGEPLLMRRRPDGAAVVLSNVCPHRFAPLHLGQLEGDRVRCGYHGLVFDAAGRCVENPNAPGAIPEAMRLKQYPAVERYGLLWIWMGDREPDLSMMPDFSMLDDPSLAKDCSCLAMDVNVELLCLNLMDLSHASFLHAGLIATPEHANADIRVTQQGLTVRCDRLASGVPVPQVFDLMYRRDGRPVDFWNSMRWDPPSHFFLDVGCCEPGGDRERGARLRAVHILTPESPQRTHYFVGGIRRVEADEDPALRQRIAELRLHAFKQQDEPMMLAMQEMLGLDELLRRPPVLLGVDGGPVRMQRVMAELRAREGQP
jgi:phenylpropionate dioxygenase-like ring-hydroxylating dioxygenase large terminal subunit